MKLNMFCPKCGGELVERHGAEEANVVPGGHLMYVECLKCEREIELFLNYATRWESEGV